VDTTQVEYNVTPTHEDLSKEPTVDKVFTFDKWTPDIVPATGDAVYTATFKTAPRKYTITWHYLIWEGEGDGPAEDWVEEEWEYGSTPSLTPGYFATPSTEYIFTGWSPEVVPVDGEASYTATYRT
jgi:hypothetical protein